MASITIVAGPKTGDYYPLGKRTIVIGRDESCPVQVTDERVSRKHLQLRFDEAKNQHILLDMKSANGTWVNGRQLTGEIALVDNDEITIGSSKIVFTLRDFPDRESALNHYKERGQKGQPTIQQR
jgi:pSer/pThr/pTyr-binding forkhead associated (FHA) protein